MINFNISLWAKSKSLAKKLKRSMCVVVIFAIVVVVNENDKSIIKIVGKFFFLFCVFFSFLVELASCLPCRWIKFNYTFKNAFILNLMFQFKLTINCITTTRGKATTIRANKSLVKHDSNLCLCRRKIWKMKKNTE